MYEGKRFVAGGFRQHELYFPDGCCPSEAILQRFLAIVEAEPGAHGAPCWTGSVTRMVFALCVNWDLSVQCIEGLLKSVLTGRACCSGTPNASSGVS